MKKNETGKEEFFNEFFDESSIVTNSEVQELGKAISDLRETAGFQADVLKDNFVHNLFEAMEALELNANQFARKWGKSRQYVSKLLKTEKGKNFTIDTLVEAMGLLGRRVEIHYPKHGVVTHVLHCLKEEPVRPKFRQTNEREPISNVVDCYEDFAYGNYAEVEVEYESLRA